MARPAGERTSRLWLPDRADGASVERNSTALTSSWPTDRTSPVRDGSAADYSLLRQRPEWSGKAEWNARVRASNP
jgi:hypothetical protein